MTAYLSPDIKAIACYFKILTTVLGLLYLQVTKDRELNKIDNCLVASPPKSPSLGDFEKEEILEFKAVSRFKVPQIWGI
ncbi:hypothetical protein ACKFKG_10255 [Phormidesmis sp. 146-35]